MKHLIPDLTTRGPSSSRGLKNFIQRAVAAACLPCLGMGCASQRTDAGKHPALPPIAVSTVDSAPKEESIVAFEPVELQAPNEVLPLVAAAALLPLAKDALKWINKNAWQWVGDYADKFGATYSANDSLANFVIKNASPKAFPFVFRRTVTFKNKAEADQILGPGHLRGSSSGHSYRVVVVEVPFVLMTSGGDSQLSWRFVAANSPSLQGYLSSEFPRKMLYQARKAKALGVSSIDKFEVSITVQCRISEASAAGGYTLLSDPASASLSGDKLIQRLQQANLEGDWMPAPKGRSYSVKCTVAESSKMKDLLKKASEKGKGAVDSAIDKLTF